MRRPTPTAAKAAPTPAIPPGWVRLRCEDAGETRPFAPDHAARILALQERMGLSGDGSWQPAAAPDTSESA